MQVNIENKKRMEKWDFTSSTEPGFHEVIIPDNADCKAVYIPPQFGSRGQLLAPFGRTGNAFSAYKRKGKPHSMSIRPSIKVWITENLSEPLENRLNPLIYKAHEELNFSPKWYN